MPSPQDRDILEDFPKAKNPEEEALTKNLVEDFKRFRNAPVDSVRTLFKHVLGTSWRGYESYIGQQLYTPGLTEVFKQKTLSNPALQEKIGQLATAQLDLELPLPDGYNAKNLPTFDRKKKLSSEEKALQKLIKARAERYPQLQQWLTDMSNRMVDELSASYDHKSVLQFMAYIVAQIFSRTYHQGVHVNVAQIQALKKKATELQAKKQSLIFLPCHKSHIDYMSIHFICFRLGLSLPAVVAGDNLNFAVIGPMLRQVGAVYIRRSFGADKLYGATMQAFVEMLLANGFNFECFIEGTRSRSGKLLPPKFGILKVIVEAILSGRVEDSWIVPVSTQYDKVPEAETYATELLGREKVKENFTSFLSAGKMLALKMGRVDIRFNEPWSLREFITTQVSRELTRGSLASERIMKKTGSSFSATSSSSDLMAIANDPTILTPEVRIRILRALGYRVLADINAISVVMPTSLIGTMLLTNRGRGMSKDNLERRVRWLIDQIRKHGGKIGDFQLSSIEEIVNNGLQVLGSSLVGEETRGLLQTTYHAKDPFKLSYYRNQVIHLFVPESIVAVAMYSKILNMPNSEDFITYSDLLGRVIFLSRLLSGEFVFGPDGIQTNLDHTLQNLVGQNVVVLGKHADPEHPGSNEETIIRISPVEVAQGRENFDFYCFFVWPFVDGFWLTLVSLFALTPTNEQLIKYFMDLGFDRASAASAAFDTSSLNKNDVPLLWIEERAFLNSAQTLGKTLYHQGIVTYYEAVNKEMLKNALLQYVAEGIVIQRKADGRPTMYALHPAWMPVRYYPETGAFGDTSDPVQRQVTILEAQQKHEQKIRATGQVYVDMNDDPNTVHVLRRGDIVPQGKLYDFEESVAHTRRLIRLRRDSPSLTVPVLRLVSSLLDGSKGHENVPKALFSSTKTEERTKKSTPVKQARNFISSIMGVPDVTVIQSVNQASKPENDNTTVTVSRPSKVMFPYSKL